MKILDVPIVRQSTDYTCGCAALEAVLYYYGIDIHEDTIADGVDANPQGGSDIDELVSFAKKHGLKAKQYHNKDIPFLISCIDKDIPVIVNLQAWSDKKNPEYSNDDDGHYVTAIGYTDDKIIFSDPSCLCRVYLTYDELKRRWHDSKNGKKYDHAGIVVWGKKPTYNSKKIKKMK